MKKHEEMDPQGVDVMRDVGKPNPAPNLLLSEVERYGNKEYYNRTYLPKPELIQTMATPCFQEPPLNPISEFSQGFNKAVPLFRPRNLLKPSGGTSKIPKNFFDRYLRPVP